MAFVSSCPRKYEGGVQQTRYYSHLTSEFVVQMVDTTSTSEYDSTASTSVTTKFLS
jgi:hypothetical protein